MTDPERATGSARHPRGVDVSLMGPLQTAEVVVVAAEHVRRAREELEILRAERRGPVDAGQRLERLPPLASGVELATSFQFGDRIHRSDYRALAVDSLPFDNKRLARLDTGPLSAACTTPRGRSRPCASAQDPVRDAPPADDQQS